jgi:acyl carrier protein
MHRSQILHVLIELARNVLDEDDLNLSETTLFSDLEAWDSMNHVRMVVAMERAFKIRFAIGDLQRVVSVADLIDIIATAIQSAS